MANNKPTILLGAGAVLDIGGPLTKELTQRIIKEKKYTNYSVKGRSGEYPYFETVTRVYNYLKEKCSFEPNFEHLFHVLEMLSSYNFAWHQNCMGAKTNLVFAPFIVPEEGFASYEINNMTSLINQCRIDIMDRINEYDENFKENKNKENFRWYKDFWNEFNDFDLFNLNYDTTVEQSLPSYCDGFVDSDDMRFQKFDPRQMRNEDCKYKVCHLHGCILYGRQRYGDVNHDVYDYRYTDMYKWKNYSVNKKGLQNSLVTGPFNQCGESFDIDSIVIGLRKTDKVTVIPYNYYHHYLNAAILNNKSLLIVGYSFGDLYINDLIEHMNVLYGNGKRIVVITKWDGCCNEREKERGWNQWDPSRVNEKELLFIKRMMHDDSLRPQDLDENVQNESLYISKEKDVMLFVNGFKKGVLKYGKEIVDFLEN